jgi:hypothetical protein
VPCGRSIRCAGMFSPFTSTRNVHLFLSKRKGKPGRINIRGEYSLKCGCRTNDLQTTVWGLTNKVPGRSGSRARVKSDFPHSLPVLALPQARIEHWAAKFRGPGRLTRNPDRTQKYPNFPTRMPSWGYSQCAFCSSPLLRYRCLGRLFDASCGTHRSSDIPAY